MRIVHLKLSLLNFSFLVPQERFPCKLKSLGRKSPPQDFYLYGKTTVFHRKEAIFKWSYNIPKTFLLNRSPVPTIDLKCNRSGLSRHMIAELVVGWEDYVASVQTMSIDMIKLQLSQHVCRATKIFCHARVSCRIGVTLCCDFYTFRSCNTCTFSLPNFAVLRHRT